MGALNTQRCCCSLHLYTVVCNFDVMQCCVSAAVLLIKAVHEWKQKHGSKLPSGSAQRTEFKDIIKSWQRQIDGIPIEVL